MDFDCGTKYILDLQSNVDDKFESVISCGWRCSAFICRLVHNISMAEAHLDEISDDSMAKSQKSFHDSVSASEDSLERCD